MIAFSADYTNPLRVKKRRLYISSEVLPISEKLSILGSKHTAGLLLYKSFMFNT